VAEERRSRQFGLTVGGWPVDAKAAREPRAEVFARETAGRGGRSASVPSQPPLCSERQTGESTDDDHVLHGILGSYTVSRCSGLVRTSA